jgi:hypothetical protein
MSIGITLLSETRKKIVCVTDQQASFKGFSSERMAQKSWPFWGDWVALYAGKDIEYATPILEDTADRLYKLAKISQCPLSPKQIGNALQESWWEKLDEKIELAVLRRHKITLSDFLSKGRKQFTESVYNNLCLGSA